MKTTLRRRLIALLVPALLVPAAFGQAAQNVAVVKGIAFAASDRALDVSVQIAGEWIYQPLVLSNPTRLVVDIAPALRIEAAPLTEVNAFGMTNIRTGMFQSMIARIIFDFADGLPPYELRKTAAGFAVRFTRPEEAAAKPEAAPVPERTIPQAPPAAKQAAAEEAPAGPPGFYNTTIGVFGGTYTSPSEDFKDVYGDKTSFQYGLNLTRTLLQANRFQVDATFELRTFSKTGAATITGEEAKFSLTPVTIGARVLYQTKYVMPFLGFGADFYSYEEVSALANTTGSASGTHFQAGLYVIFPGLEALRLKLYYKYTSVTTDDLGGFTVGLGGAEYGLGLSFGFNVLNRVILAF